MPGDHLKESGGARVTQSIVSRLPPAGLPIHQFVLLQDDDGSAQVAVDEAVPLTYGSQATRLRGGIVPGFLRLLRLSRKSSVVFAASEIGSSLLLGYAAARLTRRPFAVLVQNRLSGSVDEWVPRRLRPATRWVHAHADLSMCVSPGLVDEVLANGLPPERVAVVRLGVDVDALLAAAKSGPLPLDPPYLIAVGRLSPQKGFDLLIRAYASAGEVMAGYPLVIVGEGPEREALEQLAAELGVAESVVFAGFVENPQRLLAAASLFVLSSRFEGMGLVVLEALTHGVPVIATDCVTGPRYLLRDGELGDLIPVNDVDALTSALIAHMASPERLRAMAAAGQARARELGPDKLIADVRDALVRLADDGR